MKDITNKPFWEESFSKLEAVDTFGEPAEELVSLVNSLPSGASVLDIGCGEGRNALHLAEQGFNVAAIDISAAGIRKLKYFADQNGFSIAAEVQDMKHTFLQTSMTSSSRTVAFISLSGNIGHRSFKR